MQNVLIEVNKRQKNINTLSLAIGSQQLKYSLYQMTICGIVYNILSIRYYQYSTLIIRNIFIQSLIAQRFITTLELSNLNLQDECLQIIKRCSFRFIRKLFLNNNLITQKGVKAIVQCQWKYLYVLKLGCNPIKNKGLWYLSKGDWPRLNFLNFQSTSITDEGVKCLIKSQWHKLKALILSQNILKNQSLKRFTTFSFHSLSILRLQQLAYDQMQFLNSSQMCKIRDGRIRAFSLNKLQSLRQINYFIIE